MSSFLTQKKIIFYKSVSTVFQNNIPVYILAFSLLIWNWLFEFCLSIKIDIDLRNYFTQHFFYNKP